jgi:hypothetical protein
MPDAVRRHEVWFLTGSQGLYGPETLAQVATQSQQVCRELADGTLVAGLVAVRSAITVYARTETAFASLRDNIQQILAGLARLVDPKVEPHELFPRISEKLSASLKLRGELAAMIKTVRAAETDAGSKGIPDNALLAFVEGPVPALFYKDRESVERFVEEIRRTQQRKDLVPILHRFGAYLETLFGHVNPNGTAPIHSRLVVRSQCR